MALGFGLVIAFLLSSNLKTKFKGIIVSLLSIVFITFAGNYLSVNPISLMLNRFSSFTTDGGTGRLTIWSNAINTFFDNPIVGIGINSVRDYNLQYFNRGVYLHNSLLEVLVETGIVGMAIYTLFWVLLFISAVKLYIRNKKTIYILLTLVAMFIQMNSLSILYNEVFYLFVLILYKYSLEYSEKKSHNLKIRQLEH